MPPMTPFIRIPFVLIAAIAHQRAVTPPHPPPSASEYAPPTRWEYILRKPLIGGLVVFFFWFAALAEIAVITAYHIPGFPFAQLILSTLTFEKGTAQNIRPTAVFFFGVGFTIAGSYIRWTCYRALGQMFTFELSVRKNHQLVTDGPYAIVRHPAYTGLLLVLFGTFCWHGSSGSWTRESGILHTTIGKLAASIYTGTVSVVFLGLLLRMSEEDLLMERTFGECWQNWAKRVPYKLVPGTY